jgi:L-alanine-DL-glutamate epimerase-like enolase superfamily enzyme
MPRITKLETAIVQANFHWTYVRVYTDASGGLYGTGECFFAPGLLHIIRAFENILTGEEAGNIERLVEKMRWAASGAGSTGGIVWNAISGIEAALWDAKGKALNAPVWQLLGGKFRETTPIYLDCHAAGALECLDTLLQESPATWPLPDAPLAHTREAIIEKSAARATEMAVLGYPALKFDLDLPGTTFDSPTGYALTSEDIDWMVTLTQAIRDAVGPKVGLAMDAHWRYRPNDILQVARELEACRLLWLEDPVPPDDRNALRYLRQHTLTPLGTGENLQLRQGFWPLIVDDLCDVMTPDIQKVGGLAEGRKIADMSAAANKPVAFHMIGSPLALMASAHLALTVPNFMVCEFHAHDVPFFHDLAASGTDAWFAPTGVTPPDAPGYGIELDDATGQRWRLPGTRWFDHTEA